MSIQTPLGLAIHTSSPDLGFALGRSQESIRTAVWDLGRDLSASLHVKLVEFMAGTSWDQLDFIAVAQGPGSFTGTRMGVITARTLAQQLNIPLFGISSLAAIAASQSSPQVALQLAAQRGEFHVGVYKPGDRFPIQLTHDTVSSESSDPKADRVMTLEQWQAYQAQFNDPLPCLEISPNQGNSVEQILQLAQTAFLTGERPHWSRVIPTYGQHPVQ